MTTKMRLTSLSGMGKLRSRAMETMWASWLDMVARGKSFARACSNHERDLRRHGADRNWWKDVSLSRGAGALGCLTARRSDCCANTWYHGWWTKTEAEIESSQMNVGAGESCLCSGEVGVVGMDW